jgi:hypothetical protein
MSHFDNYYGYECQFSMYESAYCVTVYIYVYILCPL